MGKKNKKKVVQDDRKDVITNPDVLKQELEVLINNLNKEQNLQKSLTIDNPWHRQKIHLSPFALEFQNMQFHHFVQFAILLPFAPARFTTYRGGDVCLFL